MLGEDSSQPSELPNSYHRKVVPSETVGIFFAEYETTIEENMFLGKIVHRMCKRIVASLVEQK
jgi:hypothetical protein